MAYSFYIYILRHNVVYIIYIFKFSKIVNPVSSMKKKVETFMQFVL